MRPQIDSEHMLDAKHNFLAEQTHPDFYVDHDFDWSSYVEIRMSLLREEIVLGISIMIELR